MSEAPDQTLPARPRLRPGLTVLHRRSGEFQVGVRPGRATVVSGVPTAVLDAAEEFRGGRTTAELLSRAGPEHRAAMVDLLSGLAGEGLVEDASGPGHPLARRMAPESTLAARRGTADPATRARCGVAVHGDGRLAVAVACQLAAAGVGRVRVSARGAVTAEDVGAGLTLADIGRPRRVAANEAVARAEVAVDTTAFTHRRPDLVLVADALVPDPALLAELHARAQPHLPLRAADGVGTVGPLVVPGHTACLTCAEHHRTARDECWPLVAAQLTARPHPTDLATLHATAAVATAHTLAALALTDLTHSRLHNTTLEVDPLGATLTARTAPPHPHCPCGAATRGRAEGVAGTGTVVR
ncbi:UBA/THIF-type NAD/FAD binding protein [Actinokineospora spheciospongiae]|uniref:UBA/THIF-type NAD/FAD binding protein n=1 Tax=Actinokineospora spheciospongiae TaxID=909613 RepID=W7IQ73_9PSEU|nr:TOMM precursor leader peptide-binding protein [Actinokineospora spheciospongiae]EWC63050.1 UBA/THIF-type NAD/FAD binding protein [Actinokineospora spheciospongiae]